VAKAHHPLLVRCKYANGEIEYRTPRQVLESIQYARGEIDYSNYDTFNLDIAQAIIRDWYKIKGIPLGPTQATLEKRRRAAEDARRIKEFGEVMRYVEEGGPKPEWLDSLDLKT
jgi:hypothetical protein